MRYVLLPPCPLGVRQRRQRLVDPQMCGVTHHESILARAPGVGTVAGVSVFDLGSSHEQVVFCNDPASGLRAIIAIYSTSLGPALGGTRFYPYETEQDALADVL